MGRPNLMSGPEALERLLALIRKTKERPTIARYAKAMAAIYLTDRLG